MSGNRQRDLKNRQPTGDALPPPSAAELAVLRQIQREREHKAATSRMATDATIQIYSQLAADAIRHHCPTEDDPVPGDLLLELTEQARLAGLYMLQGLGLGVVNGAAPPAVPAENAGESEGSAPPESDEPARDSPIVIP